MNTAISLRLKSSLKKRLEKKAKELKLKTNDLIVKALEDFLYLEQLNTLRSELTSYALKKGFNSEEDIFKRVS